MTTLESDQVKTEEGPRKSNLAHEQFNGSPCLKCPPEVCEGGLDLHFWRKICKNCKCPPQDHDIRYDDDKSRDRVMEALFYCGSGKFREHLGKFQGAIEAGKREKDKEFAFIPPGATRALIEKYMAALPVEKRPKIGSQGAKYRRQQWMAQLPIHDHDERYCDNLPEDEKEKMVEFCTHRNENALGVGELKEQTAEGRRWNCYRCAGSLNPGEVAVFASRAGEDKCWHPGCFVCATCNELLVDLIYFYKDDQIYCGRHYAEKLKPRCAACDELIFSKEYTQAEDRNWHLKHFCCFGCDLRLGGQKYVAKNGHPYCLTCYDKCFAKTCETCRSIIAADAQRLSFKEQHWHATPECFKCTVCADVLLGKAFLPKGCFVYCSPKCYKSRKV